MARTLATIQCEIEKLQKEAAAVRAKEVASIIDRMREAIEYGLASTGASGAERSVRAWIAGGRYLTSLTHIAN